MASDLRFMRHSISFRQKTLGVLGRTAAIGPGLLVMLADCDSGNVVTAAQSGAQWGIRFLPLLIALIPLLYMTQELTVRLGIFTGEGHGELIRARIGPVWAWVATAGLVIAVLGSLVTEFTGVAGVGEMYGVPRGMTLSAAVGLLMFVILTGSHKRVDRVAMFIGAFELAFFVVAWHARPDLRAMSYQLRDMPFSTPQFGWLAAALIGATFNPWMLFYQQAAVADKKLTTRDYRAARIETAAGAVLTQLLTAAVLVAAAARLSGPHGQQSLQSVGEISNALTSELGQRAGQMIFGAGVLGASLVAAIICSLALAWGLCEVTGRSRSLDGRRSRSPWFYGVYALAVAFSALVVEFVPDLVWLNVAAQVVNAVMLPLVIGLLIVISVKALPPGRRPTGTYLKLLCVTAALVCIAGFVGAMAGFWS